MNDMPMKQSLQLVDIMARMKMRAQANKLILSYLWWLLEPLLFVGVFYLVFEYLLQRGGEGFFTFLIVGKVAFMWFSKSVVIASNSLRVNKGIIGQKAMPKWIFPLASVQESTYKSLIALGLLCLFLVIGGVSNVAYWWQLIPLLVLNYLFIAGVGLTLAILVTWAEDFSQVISLAIMGLMFGSGIFWNIREIGDPVVVEWIYILNPVAALLDSYRQVLIDNTIIDFGNLWSTVIVTAILWALSLTVLNKFSNALTRRLYS